MARRTTSWAICLRFLCAVALLFVGLSHAPAASVRPAMPDMAAYVLPDGTMPDFCIGDRVHGKAKHPQAIKCEACRISGAALLPVPADHAGVALAFRHAAPLPLAGDVVPARRERPGSPPRAPPFLSA